MEIKRKIYQPIVKRSLGGGGTIFKRKQIMLL